MENEKTPSTAGAEDSAKSDEKIYERIVHMLGRPVFEIFYSKETFTCYAALNGHPVLGVKHIKIDMEKPGKLEIYCETGSILTLNDDNEIEFRPI